MRVRQLTLASKRGVRTSVDELFLESRRGVSGDYRSERDGSVSLLSSEAEREIRAAGGLCTDRFSANIFTAGLDYTSLRVGTRIRIEQCILEITRIGKPCFETCELAQNRTVCPLPGSCAFACVISSGTVRCGERIEMVSE